MLRSTGPNPKLHPDSPTLSPAPRTGSLAPSPFLPLTYVVCVLFLAIAPAISTAQPSDHCPSTTTELVLPVRLHMDAISTTLESLLPSQLTIGPASLRRTPIELSPDTGRLRATTRISGKIRVSVFRPTVSADITLFVHPLIHDDWRLTFDIQSQAKVVSACLLKVFGSCRVTAKSRVQGPLNDLLRTVDRRIDTRDSLKSAALDTWAALHAVERVSDEMPSTLVVKPTFIGSTQPRISDSGIDLVLFLSGTTTIVVGEGVVENPPTPLPPLQIIDLPARGRITLAVPVFSEWATLNGLLDDTLQAKPLVIEDGADRRTTVNELMVSHDDGGNISLDVSIESRTPATKGPSAWSDQITVRTTFRPVPGPTGHDLQITSRSSLLMEVLSAYAQSKGADSNLRDYVFVDMTSVLASVTEQVQRSLDSLTESIGNSGFEVTAERLPVIRLTHLSANESGLSMTSCVSTGIDSRINESLFAEYLQAYIKEELAPK